MPGSMEINVQGAKDEAAFFKVPLQPWRHSGVQGLIVVDLLKCSVGVIDDQFTVGPQKLLGFSVALAASSNSSPIQEISFSEATGLITSPPPKLGESVVQAAASLGASIAGQIDASMGVTPTLPCLASMDVAPAPSPNALPRVPPAPAATARAPAPAPVV